MSSLLADLDNVLLVADSYKITHHKQYPPITTTVYSYFESRGGKFPSTVFFGLQYILKRWMVGQVVTQEKIDEAKIIYREHFGADHFNEEGWKYILVEHGGRLPLRIKAVPEGTVVPTHNVLFTVENTDPQCYWLTNYFETLLVQVWYPMTVATNSRSMKEVIARYLSKTADNLDSLPFKLHDFGFRGASSVESGGIGGASHLVNFKGTDTIAGLMMARKYYDGGMAGFSIPAAEHSTITTWGVDGEKEAFANMLCQFPQGLVAVVSDSYNLWRACEQYWGEDLLSKVVERGNTGGALVIRPDSGDPPEIVHKLLEVLGQKFGTCVNMRGYRQLPQYLRVIQGDGIDYEMIETILSRLEAAGWSAENVTFGSGGALLQKVNRDTQKCAYKCSYAIVNDKQVDVYKDPITDPGKKSKKGRLTLVNQDGHYKTLERGEGTALEDCLVTVFENGELMREYKFDEVRANAEIDLVKFASLGDNINAANQ